MLIGRFGDWDHSTSTGNPDPVQTLTQYRKGYKTQAWRSGYPEVSAVPISSKKAFSWWIIWSIACIVAQLSNDSYS